jgi:hypothetical protein
MVNRNKQFQIMVGVILTIIFSNNIYSQHLSELMPLNKYQKFGWMVGPAFYNRAQLDPQYGSATFKNYPIPGFNAGFEYDFRPNKRWSIISGFTVAKEPIYKVKFHFPEGDIYPNYPESSDKLKAYAIVSFSVPIYISIKKRIGDKAFGQLRTGLKLMYFPPGDAYTSATFHSLEQDMSKEVWGIKASSQDYSYYGSYIIGGGVNWMFKKLLLKTNLIYVWNFTPTIEGEYQFDHLLITEKSRGDYTLSGNYLALLFIIHFQKRDRD